MGKQDLRSLNLKEMEILVTEWGYSKFRARQLFHWVQRQAVCEIDDMTNLPRSFRDRLKQTTVINCLEALSRQQSRDGSTVKLLFRLADGETIETVVMNYEGRTNQRDRATVCVSSQVGCSMGCAFCATGLGGWKRNLSPGEIVSQVMDGERVTGIPIDNVVLMGMGEPLLNYDNVVKAIRLMNDDAGLNIGWRRISLSTCGLVPEIRRLAREKMPIVLAISLHAATDEKRDKLMPVNKKYPIGELLAACQEYVEITGRRVTFEYAMIKGINDSPQDAVKLGKLVSGIKCNVNLIPINSVPETGFLRPDAIAIRKFRSILQDMNINVVIREEKGTDIDAACGQLRRRRLNLK